MPPPPTASRLPIKALLAVGLCVAAAGVAGAIVMGRPANRAPATVPYGWSETWNVWNKCLPPHSADAYLLFPESQECGWGEIEHVECQWECVYKHYLPDICSEYWPYGKRGRPNVECQTCISQCQNNSLARHEPWKKYLSDECRDDIDELESASVEDYKNGTHWYSWYGEETPRPITGDLRYTSRGLQPPRVACLKPEQTCTASYVVEGLKEGIVEGLKEGIAGRLSVPKCFPASCKEADIVKGLEEGIAADMPQISGLRVTCMDEWKGWAKYMSDECYDLLETLEREAVAEGRAHISENGTADCKHPEQTCTVNQTLSPSAHSPDLPTGRVSTQLCMPAICKEANIRKGLEEIFAGNPEFSDFSVACVTA